MARREADAYYTPEDAAEIMCDRVLLPGNILEPCSGDLAIVNVLKRLLLGPVVTNDLRPSCPADYHMDACDPAFWRLLTGFGHIDCVVTNPPFVVAPEIIRLALRHARRRVAMFLRLSILEPCADRIDWLTETPPTRQIVLPRISFTGDGDTDSVTCAWYIWERFHESHPWDKGTIEIVGSLPSASGKGSRSVKPAQPKLAEQAGLF